MRVRDRVNGGSGDVGDSSEVGTGMGSSTNYIQKEGGLQ